MESKTPTLGQLISVTRPSTAVYAFLVSLVSFWFYEGVDWRFQLLTSTTYAFLTASIMVFNDLVDAEHDRRKGKRYVSENHVEVVLLWLLLSLLTALLIAMVAFEHPSSAVYCGIVWFVGIVYSFGRKLFLVNNIVVAMCSGSPALVGMVYRHQYSADALFTFLLLTSLVFWNEVYKDIEDEDVDEGYKATLPTMIGHRPTVLLLITMQSLLALMFILHPSLMVRALGILSMPILAYVQLPILLKPHKVSGAILVMRRTLQTLLVILLYAYWRG